MSAAVRLLTAASGLLLLVTVACGDGDDPIEPSPTPVSPTPDTSVTATTSPGAGSPAGDLRPPDSDTPAAGACAGPSSGEVTIEFQPGIPSPRCVRVLPGATLRIVNSTPEPVDFELGSFKGTLQPEDAATSDQPVGGFLAPGVHVIKSTAYGQDGRLAGSGEVWLIEDDGETTAAYGSNDSQRRICDVRLTPLLAATTLVLLAAACGDDSDDGPTVTSTASPTAAASVPPGEFPSGVIDLARTLGRALTNGDVDLSKWSRFSDYDCGFDIFPAPGPDCVQVSEGEGTKAMTIRLLNSEGGVYTAPAYGRFLSDYIYDALSDASDEYGDGASRIYALADMPDEFEPEQGDLGTYEICAGS